MVAAWDDPEWIKTELDRLDRWRERWGFADVQYSYFAQLQDRVIDLRRHPRERACPNHPADTPAGTIAARPA